MKIQLVISGGQSGADLAGNVFAREMKIPTAIFSFPTFEPIRKEDHYLYSTFPHVYSCSDGTYASQLARRTEFNIQISEATVIFVDGGFLKVGSGSELTYKLCKKHTKPRKIIFLDGGEADSSLELQIWLQSERPVILNVAGSRTCDMKKVKEILKEAYGGATRRR